MIRKRLSAALKAFTMRFSRPAHFLQFLPRTSFNYAAEVGDGMGSSTVMAPIWWLMRTFPEAPVVIAKLMADGGREEIASHPMTELIRRPNPFYAGNVLWMATVMDVALTGNGYWLLPRENDLRVREIWWVPSTAIRAHSPDDGSEFIDYYEYRPGGREIIRLDRNDLVHFRYGMDPDDPRYGLSPLASVLREIFTDDEAANFTASLLRNNGMPTLAISPKTEVAMSDDDMRAVKTDWMDKTTGDKRGEPLISDRPFDLHQFGFNPQQMDLKSIRRIPEERVTAVTGIPAIVAGLGAGLDRSTFANMSEAREMAYESAVIPLQRLVSSDLGTQLLPHFEGKPEQFWIGFDLGEVRVLQEDENEKVERLTKEVTSGVITVAEYRRERGLEVRPSDEIYLRPISLIEVPVGQVRQPSNDPNLAGRGKLFGDFDLKAATPRDERFVRQIRRMGDRLVEIMSVDLENEFRKLGDRASEIVRARGIDFSDEKTRNGSAGFKQTDDPQIEAILSSMNLDEVKDANIRPVYERHYLRAAEGIVETTNQVMGLNVNLPDPVARQVIQMGGRRAGLLDLAEDTRLSLFDALSSGRAEGLGPDALARRVREVVPAGRYREAGSAYRARMIARTETRYAQNFSAVTTYRGVDILGGVRAIDGGGDEDCAARNGSLYSFDNAQLEMDREHPNGTLSFAPVTREEFDAGS